MRGFFGLLLVISLDRIHGFAFQSTHLPVVRRQNLPHLAATAVTTTPSTSSYLATCIPGLSDVLVDELRHLGVHDVCKLSPSAVSCTATLLQALACTMHLRTAHKFSELLASSDNIHSKEDLEYWISTLPVAHLLGDGCGGLLTLSVVCKGRPSAADLSHTHFTALTVKNALCDAVRQLRGDRPYVDTTYAQVPLVVHCHESSFTLYRCLHHGSLHERGYRTGSTIHKAALKESLAAGLLLRAGWPQGNYTLVDPMAGSGTLVIEALLLAADISPGLMRMQCGETTKPPVLYWKHDDEDDDDAVALYKQVVQDAAARAKTGLQTAPMVYANEQHAGALRLLEESVTNAGLSRFVHVTHGDCRDWQAPRDIDNNKLLFVTNPPWGVRLDTDMEDSWEALRQLVRRQPCELWVLSGNPTATKHLGLSKSQSLALQTGKQDLRWIQYLVQSPEEREQARRERQERDDLQHAKQLDKPRVEESREAPDHSSRRPAEQPTSRRRPGQPNNKYNDRRARYQSGSSYQKVSFRKKTEKVASPTTDNEWI